MVLEKMVKGLGRNIKSKLLVGILGAGLAFSVYGCGDSNLEEYVTPVSPQASGEIVENRAPEIKDIIANPNTVNIGEKSEINCVADDADNDILTYSWDITEPTPPSGGYGGAGLDCRAWGTDNYDAECCGDCSTIQFTPQVYGDFNIECIVDDGELSDSDSIDLSAYTQCFNGIDDDGDTNIDFNDLGCYNGGLYDPGDNDETDILIEHIVINEFESNPAGTDTGNEWIELYNKTGNSIDLTNWYFLDMAKNAIEIPDDTIIDPDGYAVISLSSALLNNSGEDLILFDSEYNVVDSIQYNLVDNDNDDTCWARIPNGSDTDTLEDFVFQTCTQGTNNDEPPIIPNPCSLYDDFSSSTLDPSKWLIKQDLNGAPAGLTDVYEVDTVNQNYDIAQTFSGSDKGTVLTMTKLFNAGETVDLEIMYNSGSGNQEGKPYFNGIPLDLVMAYAGYNCGGCPTSGDIGYWNGDSEVSNTLGLHHLWVEFNGLSNTKITFTRPDLTNFTYTATTITYPVEFGVGLRTGGNGIASYSFDNFEICTY